MGRFWRVEVVVVQDELLAAEPLAPLLLDGDGQCRLITGALSLTFKKPLVIYRIHLQSQGDRKWFIKVFRLIDVCSFVC